MLVLFIFFIAWLQKESFAKLHFETTTKKLVEHPTLGKQWE